MDSNRLDNLTYLIASLREKFPFGKDVDIAEITHSPEWCLEAMIRECGWRPIETAPKDGTKIIAFDKMMAEYFVAFFVSTGWIQEWRCDGVRGPEIDFDIFPTHWMPLPQPPAGSP